MKRMNRKFTMCVCIVIFMILGGTAFAAGQGEAVEEELPTLRYLGPGPLEDDPNDRYEAQRIEEVTGYSVNYEELPAENPAEQLNLIVASGEPYDVITVHGQHKDMVMRFVEEGAVRQLDDLIADYGPHIESAPSEFSRELFSIDGATYVIPTRLPLEYVPTMLLIRKDWLDQVGMDVPQTVDELTEVLRAFRDEIRTDDDRSVIPMMFTDPMTLHGLLGAFGIENPWIERDGRLVAREETEGFEAYLSFMRDLYEDGLIDSEFPANTGEAVTEKFIDGRAGIISTESFGGAVTVSPLQDLDPDAEVVVLPPIEGPDGLRGARLFGGYDFLTFVPAASRHPEHAVRWINEKLSPDGFLDTVLGVEGEHYYVEDGAYYPIDPVFQEDMGAGYWFLTGTREEDYSIYWPARLRRIQDLHDYFMSTQNQAAPYVEPDVTGYAIGVSDYAAADSRLRSMTSDFATQVIAGAESIDAVSRYVSQWRADSGEQSEADLNRWYTEEFLELRSLLED